MTKLQPRLAAGASFIGTTIEFYDFYVYATAATLIFNKIFFPALGTVAGTLVSLSTFSVAFVIRPLGAVIISHIGDKIGRRPMLVLTLTMMGAATLLIGLLPSYETIGVAAPILLILLRLIQGFALGGEYGGAVVLTLEHSPPSRRGFFASFVPAGAPLGLVLATLAFMPIVALPEEDMLSWGWRIPFMLSVVLLITGYFLRRAIGESPAFGELQKSDRVERIPALTVLRKYPLGSLLVVGSTLSGGVTFYMLGVFGTSYATSSAVGLSQGTILTVVLVTMAILFAGTILAGAVADRIGRLKQVVFGLVGMGVLAFPLIWLLSTGNAWLALLGYLLMAVPVAAQQGILGVLLAESFPPAVRVTGLSIGYTVGLILGGGIAPIVGSALVTNFGIAAVGLYLVVVSAVSTGSLLALLRVMPRHTEDTEDTVVITEDATASTAVRVAE